MFEYSCSYDKENKVWRSAKLEPIFNENISVGEIALHMMRNKNPQEIMQVSDTEDTVLTYGTALAAAIRIAQHFEKLQLTADDVVSIFATNTTYVMPVAVAAWFNGTPFQPINPLTGKKTAEQIFDISKPKIIFCDGLYYEKVKEASASLKPVIYTLCNHLENVPQVEDLLVPTGKEHHYRAKPLTKGPNQTMVVMLSSGTTGLPKGICLSNRSVSTDLDLNLQYETTFSTSSLDWLTGLFTFRINVLDGGVRIITTRPYSAEYFQEIIMKYKVTVLITNPSVMLEVSLLPSYSKKSLESIRFIIMGGSQCSVSNLKRIRAALTDGILLFCYGNTEAGVISWNPSNYKPESMGKLLPNVELKIVDPNTGMLLGSNQTGEICVLKSNDSWQGYFRNPSSTRATLDAEGFFHTADMGYMDDEHYLHIVDRLRDVMKYKGFKYSPREIETIVAEMTDVIDVCVFGVYNDVNLYVPAAAVIKRPGSSLSEIDVIKYVEQHTEVPYKRLDYGVFLVNKLPRNKNGKLMRDEILKMCLAMKANAEDI